MTDADKSAAPRSSAPQIRIMAQFIRDLSFENPRAPESLRAVAGQQPSIDMQVEMNARGRAPLRCSRPLKSARRMPRSSRAS